MSGSRFAVSALLIALATNGCGIFEPDACTDSVEPAVVVEIYNAVTGRPIAETARGAVYDGAYVDALQPYEGGPVLISRRAADERPSTYLVVVTHPGYEDWLRSGVAVADSDCHVETARLRAELIPEGG